MHHKYKWFHDCVTDTYLSVREKKCNRVILQHTNLGLYKGEKTLHHTLGFPVLKKKYKLICSFEKWVRKVRTLSLPKYSFAGL